MRGVAVVYAICVLLCAVCEGYTPQYPQPEIPATRDEAISEHFWRGAELDNPDGGVWKQGWPVEYKADAFDDEKLEVYVVMHSHNDPGWINTFDGYFQTKTKHILDNVVRLLSNDNTARFIWAEISFFSKWWGGASPEQREAAKRLVQAGQLEIVTGGWVMTDEAASHYPSTINQLFEGNQWVMDNLGVKPRYGWSIDPFGHSPTMAYLLKNGGFEAAVINRVHYEIKKELAWQRQLEFEWVQNWDQDPSGINTKLGQKDIPLVTSEGLFTHMFPFFSYDIPHTCGPQPAICAEYDFQFIDRRTDWGGLVQGITDGNVATKSAALVDQYKKKSTLYRTKNVLIPLGSDFTYSTWDEMSHQHTHHKKMHDYVKANPNQYKAHVRFATLSEYFDGARSSFGNKSISLPVMRGDWNTYADRLDHYWSGYFTTRPFMKGLDRFVETTIRAAELLHTWATLAGKLDDDGDDDQSQEVAGVFRTIQNARQMFAIFQHHDGVTGTAKDFVNRDYGDNMLHRPRWDMKRVIRDMAIRILSSQGDVSHSMMHMLDFDEDEKPYSQFITRKTLHTSEGPQVVVMYNPLLLDKRSTIVQLTVDSAFVEVLDHKGTSIPFQINPVWNDNVISETEFTIHFHATIPALGFATYFLTTKSSVVGNVPTITVYNGDVSSTSVFTVTKGTSPTEEFSNEYIKVRVSTDTGLIVSSSIKEDSAWVDVEAKEDFMTYRTHESGAYLFIPAGTATSIVEGKVEVIIVQGDLLQESKTGFTDANKPIVRRTARVFNSGDQLIDSFIELQNHIDVTRATNQELITRYTTNLDNLVTADLKTLSQNAKTKDKVPSFYTDLNGLQYIQRISRPDAPLQANYYPCTSSTYIQDETETSHIRMSIHTRKSFGASGLQKGTLEVMLDRKLGQDDGRGLGEQVADVVPMDTFLYLSFEKVEKRHHTVAGGHNHMIPANPTIYGHYLAHTLNHPIQFLYGKTIQETGPDGAVKFDWNNKFVSSPTSMLSTEVASAFEQPHPFHIVAAKVHKGDKSKVVAHVIKLAFDAVGSVEYSLDLSDIFDFGSYEEMALTLMHDVPEESKKGIVFDAKCEYCVDLRTFLFSTNAKPHTHDGQVHHDDNTKANNGLEVENLLAQIHDLEKQNEYLQQQLQKAQQTQQDLPQKQQTQPPKHQPVRPTPIKQNHEHEHSHLQEDWSVFSIVGVSCFFIVVLLVLYILGLLKDITRTRMGLIKVLMAFMFMHVLYFTLSMLHII